MCYLRCRPVTTFWNLKISQSLLENHLSGTISRLRETATSGAGLCFVDNWRAFLMEMKSSAYGNLNAKANVINLTKFKEYLDN